jgi:uncharacterized membrane protein
LTSRESQVHNAVREAASIRVLLVLLRHHKMVFAALMLVLGFAPELLVALALASIVFLCTLLIVAALMLRSKWNDISDRHTRHP